MSSILAALVSVAATAAVAAAGWVLMLPRLPEPAAGDAALGNKKTPYAELVTRGRVITVTTLAAAAGTVGWLGVPDQVRPLWVVFATVGVVLAAIDGYTTWIPAVVTRWGWAAMAAATVASLLLGASWTDLMRTFVGALLAGGLFLVLWLATRGGFGFGDVRFVPLVAAPCAALGWTPLIFALLAGSGLGIGHALWRRVRRVVGVQPWAPALVCGAYLAVVMRLVVSSQ